MIRTNGDRAAAPGSRRSVRSGHATTVSWTAAVGIAFFLLSHPIAMIPDFRTSWTWAGVAIAVAALVSLPRLRAPRLPVVGVLLLVWCGLSYWWSISPASTLGWFVIFATLTAMAAVTAAVAPARAIAIGVVLGAILVSVASLWVSRDHLPVIDYALSELEYLDGVGTHRNILSYSMALGFAALVATRPSSTVGRVGFAFAGVVIAGTTYLTQSSTGLVAIAILALTSLGLSFGHHIWRSDQLRRALLVGVPLAIVVGLLFRGDVLSLLGRDGSLSSRVPLWRLVVETTKDRPFTGWGSGAVWPHAWLAPPYNQVSDILSNDLSFAAVHGHNSFVDLLLEVGLVGVGLAFLLYAGTLWRGWIALRAAGVDRTAGPDTLATRVVLLLSLALLLCGFTEPVLATPLGWFLTMLVASMSLSVGSRPTVEGQPKEVP